MSEEPWPKSSLMQRIKMKFEDLVNDYRYWGYMRRMGKSPHKLKTGEHTAIGVYNAERGGFDYEGVTVKSLGDPYTAPPPVQPRGNPDGDA